MAKIDLSNFDKIIVLDFGSQYNQLITRRIRDFGIYSELLPHTITAEEVKKIAPKGIIFSGGRARVTCASVAVAVGHSVVVCDVSDPKQRSVRSALRLMKVSCPSQLSCARGVSQR